MSEGRKGREGGLLLRGGGNRREGKEREKERKGKGKCGEWLTMVPPKH